MDSFGLVRAVFGAIRVPTSTSLLRLSELKFETESKLFRLRKCLLALSTNPQSSWPDLAGLHESLSDSVFFGPMTRCPWLCRLRKNTHRHMLFPHLLFWSGYRSLSFEKWSTRFPNTSLSLWMATDDGLDNAVGHAVVGTLRERKRSRHAWKPASS